VQVLTGSPPGRHAFSGAPPGGRPDHRQVGLFACAHVILVLEPADFCLSGRQRASPRLVAENVVYSMLDPNPARRITASQVLRSQWGREIKICKAVEERRDPVPPKEEVVIGSSEDSPL
jgi:hypothetical protein